MVWLPRADYCAAPYEIHKGVTAICRVSGDGVLTAAIGRSVARLGPIPDQEQGRAGRALRRPR